LPNAPGRSPCGGRRGPVGRRWFGRGCPCQDRMHSLFTISNIRARPKDDANLVARPKGRS